MAVPSKEKTLTDAVHPLFQPKPLIGLLDAQTSTEDDLRYRCNECEIYFPRVLDSVKEHFAKRAHLPVDSCVYCGGPVCEYFYNKERLVFHSCDDSLDLTMNVSLLTTIRQKLTPNRNNYCGLS